mgnify:CR=1 FL=1
MTNTAAAKEFYSIVTQKGLEKLAQTKVTGQNISLTHMAVGDGNGNYYILDKNQTELVGEVYRSELSLIQVDSKFSNQIIIEAAIAAEIGGFFIREIGIFDEDGDLFAVGKYPVTYKPQSESGTSKDLYIRMVLGFSEAPNINIYINPHNSVVSTEKFEALKLKLDDYALKDFSNASEHQQLPGLQGGSETERYHITQHEQVTVASLDAIINTDNKDKTVILNENGDGFTVTPSKEIFQNIVLIEENTVNISEKYSIYKKIVTEDIELDFNVTQANIYNKIITFELFIEMPTVFAITFSENTDIHWLNDDAAEFTDAGNYLLAFRSFDNGNSWIGSLQGMWT